MPRKNTDLTDEVKTLMVRSLACWDTVDMVTEALREQFKIDVPRTTVGSYDPTKYSGRNLSKRWRDLFFETRNLFKQNITDIPIANRAHRLRAIERMATRSEKIKNYALAAHLYEQAAKECGDVYTNKQKIEANVKATARTVIVPAKAEEAAG